jgi:hypothetical protein
VDRKPKYHTTASNLVRPHQRFCLNTNTRIGHLRNNSRTFINRLQSLWFLNLVFLLCFFFLSFFYFYSCIINSIITILLFLFLPSSFSLVLSPNYSFCSFSSTLSTVFTSSSHPPSTCHHTTLASYTLTICWLAYHTNSTQLQPPAILGTNILHYNNRNTHQNTHEWQNSTAPYLLSYPSTPFPATPFYSATFTNSPKYIINLINITPPNSDCL